MSTTKEQPAEQANSQKSKVDISSPSLDYAWKYLKTAYGITPDMLSDYDRSMLESRKLTGAIKSPVIDFDKKGRKLYQYVSLTLAYSPAALRKINENREKGTFQAVEPDRIQVILREVKKTIQNCLTYDDNGRQVVDTRQAKFWVNNGSSEMFHPMVVGDPANAEDMDRSCQAVRRLLSYRYDNESKKTEFLFANAGETFTNEKLKNQPYLVSYDFSSRTFVGMPVIKIKSQIENTYKDLYGYDIKQNPQIIDDLANGKAVAFGKDSAVFYQYDTIQRTVRELSQKGINEQLLVYHEASRVEKQDAGQKQQVEPKQAEQKQKTQSQGQSAEAPKAEKKSRKKAQPIAEPEKKEKKGQKMPM